MWKSSLYSQPNYWCRDDEDLIDKASILYDEYNERKLTGEENLKGMFIPKTFHFIWLGSTLPNKYSYIIDSWRRYHPDWEVIVWDDEAASSLHLVNQDSYRHAPNFGMKSDILRYEILSIRGGVYIDVDYECIRNIDDIVMHCDFFAGFSHTTAVEINNGMIGCIPQHELLHTLIKEISSQEKVKISLRNSHIADNIASFMGGMIEGFVPLATENSKIDTIAQTGPGMLTRVVDKYMNSLLSGTMQKCSTESVENNCGKRVVLFPIDIFHPVPNDVRISMLEIACNGAEALKRQFVTDSTVAIHWWQRSWQNKNNLKVFGEKDNESTRLHDAANIVL